MKKARNLKVALSLVIAAILLLPGSGCDKDDTPEKETIYNLNAQDVLGVTGTATFTETSKTSTTITLKLFNAPTGTHPAALYMNTVAEGGTIVAELNPIDDSGISSTRINMLTYNQLIEYDGFIRILKDNSESSEILAQGDIGGNVITDTNVIYTLNAIDNFGVSGTALFEKRKNENTLVTINLEGTIAGEFYPATINLSSVTTIGGGPVTKTLNLVDGNTGKSYTTIRKLDGGMDITYANWLVYNGYINIYQSAVEFENIISQGDIGSNAN
ncbi:hypothetical protein [Natronoflexus pectinivorans]|nr:hypothetical protein [Natronoflexus pectinivorans]